MALGGAVMGAARILLGVEDTAFRRDMRAAEGTFDRTARNMETRSKSLTGSMTAMTKAFAGFAIVGGAAGAGLALRSTVNAAIDAEKAENRLTLALNQTSASMKQRAEAAMFISALSKQSAFDDELLSDGLTKLTRLTGDVTTAQERLAIATDIARARDLELEQAIRIVERASLGQVQSLRRVGIEIPVVKDAQNALKASGVEVTQAMRDQAKATDELATRQNAIAVLQKSYAGSAEDYGNSSAGAQDRFRVAVENLQEELGQALLPTIRDATRLAVHWTESLAENEDLQNQIRSVVKTVAGGIRDFAKAADDAADAVGGWDNAIQLLFTIGLVKKLDGWTGAIGKLIGVAPTAAAAGGAAAAGSGLAGASAASLTLRTRLLALTRLPTIAIALTILVNGREIDDYLKNELGPLVRALEEGDWKSFLFGGFFEEIGAGQKRRDTGAGATALPGKGVVGAAAALTQGGARALPSSFRSTHPTSGLPGYPALDVFMDAGTPVGAPESGVVVRVDRSNEGLHSGQVFGAKMYLQGDSGAVYFITHIYDPVAQNTRVRRGDYIGRVSEWSGGAEHVHIGKNTTGTKVIGATTQPYRPAGGGGGKPPPKPATLKEKLDLGLAEAEVTKSTADDLKALRAIEAYLVKRIGLEQDVNKRIQLLRELKGTRSAIATLTEKDPKKKKDTPEGDLVPVDLQLRLAEAELTKKLTDDIKALTAIEAYLDKRLDKERNINKKLQLARELKSVRAQLAAAQAQRVSGIGPDTKFSTSVAELIGQGVPGPGQAAIQFQPGQPLNVTPEKNTRIQAITAKFAVEVKPLKEYGQQLINKKKAAEVKLKAAETALAKLLKVPKKLQNPARIAAQRKLIAGYKQNIKELQAAIVEVVGAYGALERAATEEILAIANEPEEGGGGGGDAGAASESAAPTAAPVSPTQLSPEFRLASAQAALTETLTDDLSLALQQQALFQARLAGATNIEDKIALTTELGGLERSISAIRGSTNLPAQLRLAMARAAGTTGTEDDLPLVLQQQEILRQRLADAQLAHDIEAEIALTTALNSIAQQIEQMNGTLQDGTLNVKDQTLATFLGDILKLRSYQSNIFDPLNPLRQSAITVNNYYKGQPEDPVAWSSAVKFDLTALLHS